MAAARGGRLVERRLPWWVTMLALVATAAWVVPVVLTRAHGFDISDQGSYVLAYRWWDADVRNFTGAQYLYGPLFQRLDFSLAGLRLIRLATVLGAHALFGWAFVSWLRTRYPGALPSRAWAVAAVSCVVAVGGVTYGWLPLGPGYNDVVGQGCLAVMAALFRSWRAVLHTGRLAMGPALALLAPILAMLLAKWSTVVVVALLGVVFVVVALAASWFAFLLLAGMAVPATSRMRWFMVAPATAVLVLCAAVGTDSVLLHPYRTTAYDSSDRALGGTGTLAGVALGPRERAQLVAVRRAMTPASQDRRPVVALDELAGLVLLTEGRPIGEPWSSAIDPDRLAAGIRSACRHNSWSHANEPVVLAWRPVPSSVTASLSGCGVHLDGAAYREVRLPVDERTVRVYAPRD